MSDKNCYGGSAPPTCPPPPPECPQPLVLTCTIPPTATFTCPASPPPPEDCKPKEEEKPKAAAECEPPKVEEAPAKIETTCACGGPPTSAAPAAASTNSACGGNADNSCEPKPLFMTREDGSSRCGKRC